MIPNHSNVTETVSRAPCVVRWEGDNIADIVKFLGNIPVRLENQDGSLMVVIQAIDGISLESGGTELSLVLRDGDGLTYTTGGISVIRDLVYSDERPGPSDYVH